MQCVYLAASQPAEQGQLRVLNQFTETFSLNQLANKVKTVGDRLGYNVMIDHLENPRVELEDHYYNLHHTGLSELGLKPLYLTDDIIEDFFSIAEKYKDNINKAIFYKGIKWK
jgi:UDP-sulfoquinovose synthase